MDFFFPLTGVCSPENGNYRMAESLPISNTPGHLNGLRIIMKIFLSLILWCILLVICWPLALVVLILYPLVWILLLPFRIVGLTLDLVFKLVSAILLFPFRILSRGN